MAQITLQVTCTAEDGPEFRITGQVTASQEISTAIFVHKVGAVVSQDSFERVATIKDLSSVVDVRGAEGTFFRKDTCVVDYTDIEKAIEGKSAIVSRVSLLAEQQTKFISDFSGVTNHVLPEAE